MPAAMVILFELGRGECGRSSGWYVAWVDSVLGRRSPSFREPRRRGEVVVDNPEGMVVVLWVGRSRVTRH